jgi:hypothetical protein
VSEDREPPSVSLDRFDGKDWVALEAHQLLDSILLTPAQARALAAGLVAHADSLDEGGNT